MLSGFLAVLGWKMLAYTVLLVGALVRLSVWKGRHAEATKTLALRDAEIQSLKAQLIDMGTQVNDWKAKGAAAVTKANAAQLEAAELRQEAEQRAAAALLTPVPDDQALDFLRKEAQR